MPLGREEVALMQIADLIRALHRVQENSLDRYARERWGLTVVQLRLILSLTPGHPVPTLELAARLFIDPGTVTGVLGRLASKGLIHASRSDTDRRVQLVQLTAAGERVRHEFLDHDPSRRPFLNNPRNALSSRERTQLLSLLTVYACRLIEEDQLKNLLLAHREGGLVP